MCSYGQEMEDYDHSWLCVLNFFACDAFKIQPIKNNQYSSSQYAAGTPDELYLVIAQ